MAYHVWTTSISGMILELPGLYFYRGFEINKHLIEPFMYTEILQSLINHSLLRIMDKLCSLL